MRTIITFAVGFIVGLFVCGAAYAGSLNQGFQAQTMCGERGAVVANLEKTYSEAPVSIGLASNGSVIEVLASPSGSFTIILTQPNGLSCVMAAGEHWEAITPKPKGPKI